jgi:undecaprenyl-diphosphatase
VVTAFGSLEAMVLLGVVVAALLARGRMWTLLWTWIAAVAGSALIDWLLMGFFQRPRPHFAHTLLVEGSYSFPSGHAMESFVAYGMLAYLAVLWLRSWESRVAVVCGSALVVVLIGFSWMYLGVHYFSDVIAGCAARGVWLSALITGAETIRHGSKQRGNEPRSRTS